MLICDTMAEGVTWLVGEGKGKDNDSVGEIGVGRGYPNYPFIVGTPGPSMRPLVEPILTSTRYVERTIPRQVDQDTD